MTDPRPVAGRPPFAADAVAAFDAGAGAEARGRAMPELAAPAVAPDAPLSGRFAVLAAPLALSAAPPGPAPRGAGPRFELRVDVDGVAPLHRVSGTVWLQGPLGGALRVDLLGSLAAKGEAVLGGRLYAVFTSADAAREGFSELVLWLAEGTALLVLEGGGRRSAMLRLDRESPYFRDVRIECDMEEGLDFDPRYDTSTSIERPAGWRGGVLTLPSAFARAGIGVEMVGPGPVVPAGAAGEGPRPTWSDIELNDAMVRFWGDRPEGTPERGVPTHVEKSAWRLWLLGARLHDDGPTVGGLMFDGDRSPSGPQRQGAAVFRDAVMHRTGPSFFNAMTEEDAQRQLFFNLVHEAGHAFNVAHSWEKAVRKPSIPGSGGTRERGVPTHVEAWRPEVNRPHAASWMNYPWTISGFWRTFEFNFDAEELLFLRHAPDAFVMMGGAPWFVNHGAIAGAAPGLSLQVSVPEEGYEYLAPVYVMARLENESARAACVPKALSLGDRTLAVVIEGPRGVETVRPYVHRTAVHERAVLRPGEHVDLAVFVGASPGHGSHFLEPGTYGITVIALHEGVPLAVAPKARIEIHEPESLEIYRMRKAIGGEQASRVFRFQGSHVLQEANGALGRFAELRRRARGDGPMSCTERCVALALGTPYDRPRRVLARRGSASTMEVVPCDVPRAREGYRVFLCMDDAAAADRAAAQMPPMYYDVAMRYARMMVEQMPAGALGDEMKELRGSATRALASTGAADALAARLDAELSGMMGGP